MHVRRVSLHTGITTGIDKYNLYICIYIQYYTIIYIYICATGCFAAGISTKKTVLNLSCLPPENDPVSGGICKVLQNPELFFFPTYHVMYPFGLLQASFTIP